jgi:hypothetical protein
MLRFDHLRIPVTRSRRWYVDTLELTVEFEVPDRQTVALQDGSGFTIFLQEVADAVRPNGCALWFQVLDVDAASPSGRGAARLRA